MDRVDSLQHQFVGDLTLCWEAHFGSGGGCVVPCSRLVSGCSSFVRMFRFGFGYPLAWCLQGIPKFGRGTRRVRSLIEQLFK